MLIILTFRILKSSSYRWAFIGLQLVIRFELLLINPQYCGAGAF